MNLLIALTIVNFVFILIFIISKRSAKMTYTEAIVARSIGAYMLTFLMLMIIGLFILDKTRAIQLIALITNLVLALLMAVYFLKRLVKRSHADR